MAITKRTCELQAEKAVDAAVASAANVGAIAKTISDEVQQYDPDDTGPVQKDIDFGEEESLVRSFQAVIALVPGSG